MIKVDIVTEVSKLADITKVKAEVAVDAVFDAMRASMMRGERIELRGFGVFQVKPRKRIGRNPRGRKWIPPGRTIRFKPGKSSRISAANSEFGNTSFPAALEPDSSLPTDRRTSSGLAPFDQFSTARDAPDSVSADVHHDDGSGCHCNCSG
jgi:DNA-binding protein HU-beta